MASKISAYNEPDKIFFLRVCLHREVYQNNYTICYTSISTLYDCSYFEISVSKQSYTGVFSSIIMLVNSELRPAFRHRCYFMEWKALVQTTIIFWLLAILCWLMLLLIFTISFFQTLSESSLIISGPEILFSCLSLTSEMHSFLLQAEFDDNQSQVQFENLAVLKSKCRISLHTSPFRQGLYNMRLSPQAQQPCT